MNIGASLGLTDTELPVIVVSAINLVVGVSTLVTLISLMIGALRWVTSGHSDELREKAKQIIVRSLIGQIIILIAWAIIVFTARTVVNVTP